MITSEISKAGPFTGDGETLVFDFSFTALDADHVAVYVDGVKVTTGFTVELLTGGGRVTFEDAPAIDASVAIIRDVPAKQETDLQNNTAFLPEVIETAFDRLTMMIQQLRDLFSRTPVAPPTEDMTSEELYSRFTGALETMEDAVATGGAALLAHDASLASHSGFALKQSWTALVDIPEITGSVIIRQAHGLTIDPSKCLARVQLYITTEDSGYPIGTLFEIGRLDTIGEYQFVFPITPVFSDSGILAILDDRGITLSRDNGSTLESDIWPSAVVPGYAKLKFTICY